MKRILRSFIVAIVSNSLIFLPLVNANAAEALALPSGDLIAPEIKQTPITKNVPPGERANIHATVTDNVSVKTVSVFYRNVGATEFKRTEMMRELGTDDYSVTLPEIMEPGVEYYIQATDQAGNTILHGHTFSPLTIVVSPDAAPQEGAEGVVAIPQSTPLEGMAAKPAEGKISKWVWIGLGVVAVGALAGGSGGGGGTTPTTGTVTITGPTP
ncbi:MAG: hypothetical protein GXP19_00015 [Gammaproteobacteria bacterium]|nr:hypothetical protein [Gammaproteobacteria bacterium]